MSEIPYVCLYSSYLESVAPFSEAERGRLLTAMLVYAVRGEEVRLPGNERYLWPTIKSQIDRDAAAYRDRCEKNRDNGKKGGRPEKRSVFEKPKEKEKEKENEKENEKKNEKEKESILRPGAAPAEAEKTVYGKFGWIRLSAQEHARLLGELGQAELDRCIAYIDESAQSTGNKNHWLDWEVVLRRCHTNGWGLERRAQRQEIPKGASGRLGEAELEAIARVLREDA